jgi:hypothetical protein
MLYHHHQRLNMKQLTNNHLSRHHCRKRNLLSGVYFVLSASWFSFPSFILLSQTCVFIPVFILFVFCLIFQWLTGAVIVHVCIFSRQQIINWQISQANNKSFQHL